MEIPDDLDEPRKVMNKELAAEYGTQAINTDLRTVIHQRMTELYDNREDL